MMNRLQDMIFDDCATILSLDGNFNRKPNWFMCWSD